MVGMESLTTQKTSCHCSEARVLVFSSDTRWFTGIWAFQDYYLLCPLPGLLLVVSFNQAAIHQYLEGTEWEQLILQHMLPTCGVTIGIHLFPTPSTNGNLLVKRNLGSPTFSQMEENSENKLVVGSVFGKAWMVEGGNGHNLAASFEWKVIVVKCWNSHCCWHQNPMKQR